MWEHKVVVHPSKEDLQKTLEKASSDEWELVSVTHTADSYSYNDFFHLFFKRPKK